MRRQPPAEIAAAEKVLAGFDYGTSQAGLADMCAAAARAGL